MQKAVPIGEVVVVTAIFSGWFIFLSIQAVLSGFPTPRLSDHDALGLVLLEGLMFAAAVSILVARGWRTQDFLFRVTWLASFAGVLLFGALLIAHFAVWELLGSLLGGRDVLAEFARATTLSLPVALLLSVVNGAFEEFFLTRYLIEALAGAGASIALGVSALIRITYHLYQGPTGAVSILAIGLVLTSFYWRFREIWPVMLAHMIADLAALA